MLFTCFGQDQNGNYGDVDQSFESLRFQVLLGPDGTEYCKDLSRLLISMEKRYNKDGKYDPDLSIDYPRKGQVCAVLQRTKEQKEDQCFRGKTPFRTTRPNGVLQFRDRPRFFDQVGHQTTNASIGN